VGGGGCREVVAACPSRDLDSHQGFQMSFHYLSGFDIDFVVNFLIMTETDPADRDGGEIKDSQNNQKLAGVEHDGRN
jgi:hypothetical protein